DADIAAPGAFAHGNRVAGAVGDVIEAFAQLTAENPANPFLICIVIDDCVAQAEYKTVAAMLGVRRRRDLVRWAKQHRYLRHPRRIDRAGAWIPGGWAASGEDLPAIRATGGNRVEQWLLFNEGQERYEGAQAIEVSA